MVCSLIYDRFCHSHGTILDVFWGNVGRETCLGGSFLVRSRSRQFDPAHFARIWSRLGEVFGDILMIFGGVNVIINWYMISKCFLMDLHTHWTTNNEHFAWRVLQKPSFCLARHQIRVEMDFGMLFGPGWSQL